MSSYHLICFTIQLHVSFIFQNLCKLIVTDICDEVIDRAQNGTVEELDDDTSPFPEIEAVINNITMSFLITNRICFIQLLNLRIGKTNLILCFIHR